MADDVPTRHRAAACFHGMLSVLLPPLRRVVAERLAAGPPLGSDEPSLARAGVRMQLQFLRDHWGTHFRSHLDYGMLADVNTLVRVVNALFYRGDVDVGLVESGMDAAENILDEIDDGDETARQMHTLKRLLRLSADEEEEEKERAQAQEPVLRDELDGEERRKALLKKAKMVLKAKTNAKGRKRAREEAVRLLTEALALSATTAQQWKVLVLRSQYHLELGYLELAHEDASRALRAKKLKKAAALRLGNVLSGLERWEDAAKAYGLGLLRSPEDPDLLEAKQFALNELSQTQKPLDTTGNIGTESRGCFEKEVAVGEEPSDEMSDGNAATEARGREIKVELGSSRPNSPPQTVSLRVESSFSLDSTQTSLFVASTDCNHDVEGKISLTKFDQFTSDDNELRSTRESKSAVPSNLPESEDEIAANVLYSDCVECGDRNTLEQSAISGGSPDKQHTTRLDEPTENCVSEYDESCKPSSYEEDDSHRNVSRAGASDVVADDFVAAGCFHAVLHALHGALSDFISRRRIEGPTLSEEEEKQYKNLAKAGMRLQLQFIIDHWASHFASAMSRSFFSDTKALLQVLNSSYYSAQMPRERSLSGIETARRILRSFNDDTDADDNINNIISSFTEIVTNSESRIASTELLVLKSRANSSHSENDQMVEGDSSTQSMRDLSGEDGGDTARSFATLDHVERVDALDSLRVGCFYALIHLLRSPLSRFISSKFEGILLSSIAEKGYRKLSRAGTRFLLQFVKDYWADNFSGHPHVQLVRESKTLIRTLSAGYYSAQTTADSWNQGILAANRLLQIVNADESVLTRSAIFVQTVITDSARSRASASLPMNDSSGVKSVEFRVFIDPTLSKKAQRKLLVKEAKICATQAAHENAAELFSAALTFAASKKQRTKILAMRDACYRQLGQNGESGREGLAEGDVKQHRHTAPSDIAASDGKPEHTSETTPTLTVGAGATSIPFVNTAEPVEVRGANKTPLTRAPLVMNPLNPGPVESSSEMFSHRLNSSSSDGNSAGNTDVGTRSDEWTRSLLDLPPMREKSCVFIDPTLSKKAQRKLLVKEAKICATQAAHENAAELFSAALTFAASKKQRTKILAMRDACYRQLGQNGESGREGLAEGDVKQHRHTAPSDIATSDGKPGGSVPDLPGAHDSSVELHTAITLMSKRDFGNAIFWINKALARPNLRSESKVPLLVLRARCRFEIKQFNTVFKDAKEALDIDIYSTDAYYWASAALYRTDRRDDSRAYCDQGLRIDPTHQNLVRQQHILNVESTHQTETLTEPIVSSLNTSELKLSALSVGSCFHEALPTHKDENFGQALVRQQLSSDRPSTAESTKCEEAQNGEGPGGGYEYTLDTKSHPDDSEIKSCQVLLHLASEGSIVAQRYLDARELVSQASRHLLNGELRATYGSLRKALRLWPKLTIPIGMRDDLLVVGSHDAIAWGGPTLFFHLQAIKAGLDSISAEREFWKKRADKYPREPYLQAKLADILYRAGDTAGSLDRIQKALNYGQHEVSWLYLRARCIPTGPGSPNGWFSNLLGPRPPQLCREDEYVQFVQLSSIDDEWVPHACYSLGLLYMSKKDFLSAWQYRSLAVIAESRLEQLGLFPAIDQSKFGDKKKLQDAFLDGTIRLDAGSAVTECGFLRCGWCATPTLTAENFAHHKIVDCVARPLRPKV